MKKSLPVFPTHPDPVGHLLEAAPLFLSLHLHIMSEYIKSTLAILPQKVRSLQTLSSYRLDVPHIQFPTPNFQGKKSLPTRNPRAFIVFAVLLLLLFWKDIIRDVWSHLATRRPPVPVINVSPIRNNTLGVRVPRESAAAANG